MKYTETKQIKELLDTSSKIVIVQADNPDGDSLGSALALESILSDMGKQPYMYCGASIPNHLRHFKGWDRVSPDLPPKFDLSIIVDNSKLALLENLEKQGHKGWLAAKPCIVIDHHDTTPDITFADVILNKPAVATAEVIYELCKQLDWSLNQEANQALASAILSDSLGLMSEGTTARSIHIVGELVESGVQLAKLDAARKELMKKSAELTNYKGELLQRIEYAIDGELALITIPWEEIAKYSPSYNPSMLAIEDMRMVAGVKLAVALKLYQDGKITGKIRCNVGASIANRLAEEFGGGGHPYAAGFKVTDGSTLQDIKTKLIKKCAKLLQDDQT